MFGFEVFNECREVEGLWSGEAGECEGAVAFRGEELEAVFGTPFADHGIGFCVTSFAWFETFFGDFREDVLEAEEE